ncbi:histidine kinase-like ATPase [Lentinula lateritia]|uniref:Histidine kinase-like ATPase n=1 Tax=Lentinula lateritia TaxID=40482 RepID=A0ABQ8V0D6_9AGAR|nr:histidine kinase-like ATPase [Lentinula lateritia]
MSEFLTPPTPESSFNGHGAIKAIEGSSVHRLTSGQVVIDLQTAVKELVENSLDAGATKIDVRFKNCGLKSIEVIDNGSGISEKDFDSIGRKHHTSKLSAFHDLMTLTSFGFRGEALSSLCALCESVTVTTATTDKAPMGSILELDKRGEVKSRAKGVKQRGTAVLLTSLFAPLPVWRKELERNIKREFSKALALLNAYALGPCCGLVRTGTTALWGPKALGGVIDLDLEFEVPRITGRKVKGKSRVEEDVELREDTFKIHVKGLISSPTPIPSSGSTLRSGGSARSTKFFYVNGRPCTLSEIQKAINDIYRTFIPSNATSGQFPFVVADFTIPRDAEDMNVTPDKRMILVHAEAELCDRMKDALNNLFSPSRSTYGVSGTQSLSITSMTHNQGMLPFTKSANVQGSVDTQASQTHDIGGAKDDGMVEPGATTSVLSYGDVDCRLADIRPGGYAFHGTSADAAEESLGIDDPQISLIPTVSYEPKTIEVNPLDQPSPPSMETPPVPPRIVIMNTLGASWNRPKNSFGEPVNLSMQSPKITGLDVL